MLIPISKHCVENHICILKQILSKECIIPRFNVFKKITSNIYDETIKHDGGNNADYIPQLSRVNSDQYGISICTIDGQRLTCQIPFTT